MAGATVRYPLADAFWGDRYGKVVDPFGHEWAIATRMKELSPEEMTQAAHFPPSHQTITRASMPASTVTVITPAAFLEHWQGHRRLTRRVIEAFPEDQLFTFSVGGMRPFGVLALEMLTMAEPMVRGTVTDVWDSSSNRDPLPKAELLAHWDESTEQINELWPQIPPERFQETITALRAAVTVPAGPSSVRGEALRTGDG